ncbi:phosphomannomutase [uncultured Devosia sp.]|uniref:phosphomannomutase n=1 Tax=uncultured Devosia sp. TaxID=211434 RepID=UPI0035CA7F8F
MTQNSLKFGTSGLRGLVVDLAGDAARVYTSAFLRHLEASAERADTLYIGRDLRPSSQAIAADCIAAAAALGVRPVDCGALATPALALHAMAADAPSIMVTGSHIPSDRNGLKFYRRSGEITKADEAGIVAHVRGAERGDYTVSGVDETEAAKLRYLQRFEHVLPPKALAGWRLGVFEHSSVAREALAAILTAFGADVVSLGRVEHFVAVDTEAFGDPVFAPLAHWLRDHNLDAIVSADGDGDRPLLMDGKGRFVRGDTLGLLTALFLKAQAVVTPVTSNTAVEALGAFQSVIRTRVGSPYVIEGMQGVSGSGTSVIGFEANGGTLLGTAIELERGTLTALMTRDAALPLICAIGLAARQGKTLADMVDALPLRSALSDRLTDVPAESSAAFLRRLSNADHAARHFSHRAVVRHADVDGLQFWLDDGTMIHYRASGNAPELRCYVEAGNAEQAREALAWGLKAAETALSPG